MSFFSDLATAVATNLLNRTFPNLSTSLEPFKVIEISSSLFTNRTICQRNQCLVLYGPELGGNSCYELILSRPVNVDNDKVYSLCRSSDEPTGNWHFDVSKEKLPLLVDIAPELCSLPRLQEVWALIRSNHQWTIAHFTAYYGLNEAVKNTLVIRLICIQEEESGLTPLHVAAKYGRADFIKAVLSVSPDANFKTVDLKGNSLFHYAAQVNKETIEALEFCGMGDLINSLNHEGQTPLHLACLADKPECVKALISSGANINLTEGDYESAVHTAAASSYACAKEIIGAYPNQLHAKDMKHGGTPLHWARTKEVIIALIELGCLVDSPNFNGETALQVMVQRARLECVVALLTHGADPNVIDSTGNSPLHVAVKLHHLQIVQALLVFGANPNLVNNQGETARHLIASKRGNMPSRILYVLHAVGAKRCSQKLPNCSDGCSPMGKDDGKPPDGEVNHRSRHLFDDMLSAVCHSAASVDQPNKKNMPKGRILCLDGGGIRGLVLIQMLQALEQFLDNPIIRYFDWVTGTSTGGILSLALATGKNVSECKSLYFRFKDKVFVGKRPYDAENLEKFLKAEFGDKTMAAISEPKVLVTAVTADTIPADLHLFRNYPAPQDLLNLPEPSSTKRNKPEEQLIWQAARASGAAPTYFRAYGSFLDGGLISNNPTLDVLTEIQEYNAVKNALGLTNDIVNPIVIVSLGTGCKPTEQVNTLDLFRPESLLDTARLAFGVTAFGKLLVDQVTCADRRIVDRARAWCSMMGIAYFRLSPCFTQDIALDETREEVLIQMLWETQAYIHTQQAEFRKVAQLLKSA